MNTTVTTLFTALAVACLMTACSESDTSESQVFTLYRNVPSDKAFRVHVATFDSDHFDAAMSEFVNKKNCEQAQALFQGSPNWVGVKFWCEKGSFKK